MLITIHCLCFQSHVTADFILEVQVLTYSNPTHLASAFDGNCCDRSDIEISPPICIGVGTICDNSFSFCFREADSEDDSKNNCSYGQSTTELIQQNSDNLTFTVGEEFPGGVPNPVIATGQRWPVSRNLCCIYYNDVTLLVYQTI